MSSFKSFLSELSPLSAGTATLKSTNMSHKVTKHTRTHTHLRTYPYRVHGFLSLQRLGMLDGLHLLFILPQHPDGHNYDTLLGQAMHCHTSLIGVRHKRQRGGNHCLNRGKQCHLVPLRSNKNNLNTFYNMYTRKVLILWLIPMGFFSISTKYLLPL